MYPFECMTGIELRSICSDAALRITLFVTGSRFTIHLLASSITVGPFATNTTGPS